LNWRYKNHFARRYEFLTARQEGKLLAYVVYTLDNEDAEITDLFGVAEPGILAQLIAGVVTRLRQEEVVTLSAPILASHPWVAIFEKLGFRKRESCPVITYSPLGPEGEGRVHGQSWFLMQGDRES
jgi:hypothetical protein